MWVMMHILLTSVFVATSTSDRAENNLRGSSNMNVSGYTFSKYKADFGRQYLDGGSEHFMREDIFKRRLDEISAHNSKPSSWKKGVNHLTDLTDDELSMRNGYRGAVFKSPPSGNAGGSSASLFEVEGSDAICAVAETSCAGADSQCCGELICGSQGTCVQKVQAVDNFDWSPKLATAFSILEQGACGSCWAVAATAALQFHAELTSGMKFKKVLSPQSMLGCTPNEHECGGQGGCKGATAELGFEWVKLGGVVLPVEAEAYTAKDECDAHSASFLQVKQSAGVSIMGWKKIKDNDAKVLMDTLVTVGPLVTSIAAKGVQGYHGGVIDVAATDRVINHAVVMMGYGKDAKLGNMAYWNIRNSWGEKWGEKGFFRLQRFAPDAEEPCGWDMNPKEGVVCKDANGNYPEKQWVCGVAGILSDSAYPVGTTVPAALLEVSTSSASVKHAGYNNRVAEKDLVKDNAWCKTQCQHFATKELSAAFAGASFGNDVSSCTDACDTIAKS